MSVSIHNRDQAITFLYGRIDYERVSASLSATDFKLDRMRNLLDRLGNPQRRVPAVHIAGTKGKGTTASMVSSILESAGHRVGLFTSPHIDHFEERIRINGDDIPESSLVALMVRIAAVTSEIDSQGEGLSPTFFELTTALAWLWFAECQVDLAVIETGLGGRLDSTNICQPEVCVITTISRDHTHILGTRLSEIAAEKAGIIKPGVPVVSGVKQSEARTTIANTASRLDSPLYEVTDACGEDMSASAVVRQSRQAASAERQCSSRPIDTARSIPSSSPRRTNVSHLSHNRLVAISTIERLREQGWAVSDSDIESGLLRTSIPLRLEVMQRNPLVIADAAHNWLSAGALADFVLTHSTTGRRVLIFGTSSDKDIQGISRRLLPLFDAVILTNFVSSPRACPVDKLTRHARLQTCRSLHATKDPADAWKAALRVCPKDGLICIAGSFFLAAEIRKLAAQ